MGLLHAICFLIKFMLKFGDTICTNENENDNEKVMFKTLL